MPAVDRARHERLMGLFEHACDLPREEQTAFVARLAAEDAELAREVAALLLHDRAAPGTLESMLVPRGWLHGALDSRTVPVGPASEAPVGRAFEGVEDLEVTAVLAQGGMGRVMLARQRSLDREVAVKVPRAETAAHGLSGALVREARLTGALEHPNIVPVHLLCEGAGGLPVLVMKRVEGVAWSTLLEEPEHAAWAPLLQGRDDRMAAHLRILESVCHALSFAHSRGVIHRDLKPDNVMVGAFGEVYLVDWGIAKRLDVTEPARDTTSAAGDGAWALAGTPAFMAPEMTSGEGDEDARTDVYLLGATLHMVLTGSPRHEGHTLEELLAAARASEPCAYGPTVHEELAAICNRATERDPARRFSSVEDFRAAILEHVRHRGAIELSDAAHARLAALGAALSSGPSADRRSTDEIVTECHFGFHQSLRAWPENPRALAGLRACLSLMVEHELAGENLERARALLGRIEAPPADLAARVADLEARVRERRERAEKLSALERSQDWSVARRARFVIFALMGILGTALWQFSIRDQHQRPHVMAPSTMALYAGLVWVTMASLLLILRRRLFRTEVTRKLFLCWFCGLSGIVLNRALHILPVVATPDIASMDQLIAATAAAVGAVTLARWSWLVTGVFLAGALATRLVPTYAGEIFAGSLFVAFGVGAWMVERRPAAR